MAEKNRRIVTLPYGEGLQRSTGKMVVRATSFDDIRNMFLFEGKAQVRSGLLTASVLHDDQPVDLDVTVLLEPLRSLSASIGVGYNTDGTSNREVWLNRLLIDGSAPTAIGLLGVLDGGVTFVPPIIIGADSDNKFFIAHDEPNPTSRLVTQVYDPEDFPQLTNLRANLDGDGDNDVFFRGVVRHLSYIFGWGYGSASDPVRGDVVRVSLSGNSRIFEDFAFFEAGQQGETVMVCRSAGPTLMVFKETETYEIFGYSPDTFGIRLADSLFGCVGSRLAVSVAGTVFFWSTQGPRLSTGGPSIDIAVPLDIDGPDPATLVAESEPQDAFAAYDPRTRVVQFVWGQRVYALSIRDPSKPRWSYYELGERAQCSGLFFSTQSQAGGGGPPVGAPENLVFDQEARGTLTLTSNPSNGETVTIDTKTYTWQTVLTDVDGNLLIGGSAFASLSNLANAMNLGPGAGVDYAASMLLHSSMTSLGATAAPDAMVTTGKLSEGSLSNGKALTETLSSGFWNSDVTIAGLGALTTGPTSITFAIDNIDQIGAEDIEVHASTDGGSNYMLTGRVAADARFPLQQLITVELESRSSGKSIQPLTDYKFSLRYILGGLFSPGYQSNDPDVWPVASQGDAPTTRVLPIFLVERVGNNNGMWDRFQSGGPEATQQRIRTQIPVGHELLDIEVNFQVLWAGPSTDPDGFSGESHGSVKEFDQLRTIYNSDSDGYPLQFIDKFPDEANPPDPETEQINNYKMRFINAAQGKVGPFTDTIPCYSGPDEPGEFGTVFLSTPFGLSVFNVDFSFGDTPDGSVDQDGLRVCPPPNAQNLMPSGHSTKLYTRNVTKGQGWVFQQSAGPFITSFFGEDANNDDWEEGDIVRIAMRHRVRCFGNIFIPFQDRFESEWAVQSNGLRFEQHTVLGQ